MRVIVIRMLYRDRSERDERRIRQIFWEIYFLFVKVIIALRLRVFERVMFGIVSFERNLFRQIAATGTSGDLG